MSTQKDQSYSSSFLDKFSKNSHLIFTGILSGGFLGSAYELGIGTLVGMLVGGYFGYSHKQRF